MVTAELPKDILEIGAKFRSAVEEMAEILLFLDVVAAIIPLLVQRMFATIVAVKEEILAIGLGTLHTQLV